MFILTWEINTHVPSVRHPVGGLKRPSGQEKSEANGKGEAFGPWRYSLVLRNEASGNRLGHLSSH